MTVDVEEWFQGEFAREKKWSRRSTKVIQSIVDILELFDSYEIGATFFIVGETLNRYPKVADSILDSGQEVGFHGWDHRPLSELNPNEFASDLHRFGEALTDWSYSPVSFRAPSASMDEKSSWALRELKNAGYTYDSSVYPCWTPLYGVPRAPVAPYWISEKKLSSPVQYPGSLGILEFPLLALGPRTFRIPMGTGFYLRTLPPALYRWTLQRRAVQGIPAVISFHNWEFSEDIPRLRTSLLSKIYFYHNISSSRTRAESILEQFSFTSIAEAARTYLP